MREMSGGGQKDKRERDIQSVFVGMIWKREMNGGGQEDKNKEGVGLVESKREKRRRNVCGWSNWSERKEVCGVD